MPTYTTIDPTIIKNIAKAVHLATRQAEGGSYGTVQDALRFSEEYDDAIKLADAFVYGAIFDNKEHRYRNLFVTEEQVNNGESFTGEFQGGIRLVINGQSTGGSEQEVGYIQQLQIKKPSYGNEATTLDKGYWAIKGQKVYFIADACFVEVIPLEPPAFPMTPVEYGLAVFYGLMAINTPREGEFVQVAEHYGGLWKAALDAIAANVSADKLPTDKPPYSLIYTMR